MVTPTRMEAIQARFQRLEPLIDRALALDDAARSQFLQLCSEIHPDLVDDLRRALEEDSGLPELGGLAEDITTGRTTNRQGLRVGAWRLLEKIGQGGMGTVYLAERADGAFDKRAAIKLLRGEDPRFKQLLDRERRVLARLDHPGIARLLDGGVMQDGRPWLAMELAEGEDLDDWLQRARPPLNVRLQVFLAICDALSHAHSELVVHRDLKPGNIRIGHDNSVKLLDFGIAKLLSPDAASGTTRHLALTPEFAAPEQLAGESVTIRTDVYALGILLYLLLTGRSPHPHFDGNWAGYVDAITHDTRPLPSTSAASVVAIPASALRGDLDAIVSKALRIDPAQRYASVEALAQDVRRHLLDRPVLARPFTWQYRSRKWFRRHWGIAVLLGSVLLLLGSGILVLSWQRQALQAANQRLQADVQALQRQNEVPAPASANSHETAPAGDLAHIETRLALVDALLDQGETQAAEQILHRIESIPAESMPLAMQLSARLYRALLSTDESATQEALQAVQSALDNDATLLLSDPFHTALLHGWPDFSGNTDLVETIRILCRTRLPPEEPRCAVLPGVFTSE